MKPGPNKAAELVALLFAASAAVKQSVISRQLGLNEDALLQIIVKAKTLLEPVGLTISNDGSSLELVTQVGVSKQVASFLGKQKSVLSQANLEVLAMIAYNQPITRDDIDEMRGVASEQTLRNLINKSLVKTAPVSKLKTEKTTYVTTITFLNTLGISSIKDLPATNVKFKDN